MKKMSRVILLLLAIFTTLNCTFAYFNSSTTTISKINTKGYEISIDGNGGIFDSKSVVVSKNTTDLPIPKRTGYTFAGYSNSSNGEILYSNKITNIDSINQIYAQWSINSYTVDVNPVIEGTTYNSGVAGYTFDVWVNDILVADDVID